MTRYGNMRRNDLSIEDELHGSISSNKYIIDIDKILQSIYLTDDDGLYSIILELDHHIDKYSGYKNITKDPKYIIISYFHYHDIFIESFTYSISKEKVPTLKIDIDMNKSFVIDFSFY